MAAIAVVVALGILVLGVFTLLLPARTRVSPRDVQWIAGTATVPADEAEVYGRYLARHRRHRVVGGTVGILLAVIVGLQYYRSVQLIGAGDVSPFADVFFCGVAGVVVGALSAESYRLTEPRTPVVTASLAPRATVGRPPVVRTARVVTASAAVWGVSAFAVSGDAASPGIALLGLVLAALAEATRAAVTGRRRPASTPQVAHVDARIRRFAGDSVSWLQLAAATLTATWVVSVTTRPERSPVVEWAVTLVVVAGLVLSVVFLRRASPRPRRRAASVAA